MLIYYTLMFIYSFAMALLPNNVEAHHYKLVYTQQEETTCFKQVYKFFLELRRDSTDQLRLSPEC